MATFKFGCLILVAAAISLGAADGRPPAENVDAKNTAKPVAEQYFVEGAVSVMETEYALWLDAILAGVTEEADRLEKNLIGMVSYDIFVCQESVRQQASDLALSGIAQVDDGSDRLSEQRQEFQHAIESLNTREALFRSISKTDAFSNKYRLLGDYIDLLRRELKLPRLKLAGASKASSKSDGSNNLSAPGGK